ncbi:MAG: D-glycero-beta-D-manno-heptose-7-phosphate kinase [Thermodesulfobacteria bacterium]|nr:D-glycero-beta-D-manno-heptose-7-phosphate kinase [Thermodesulfobacteriota bacterium]
MLAERLAGLSFLVIGDVMLDRYFWGDVERISPEAPVPVFNLRRITKNLGGAANVAHNLRGLKTKVELAGVVGEDPEGKDFEDLAREKGIGLEALVADASRPTTVKTRVIAHSQQLLRIDVEERAPISSEVSRTIQERLRPLWNKVNGVIVSDYAKGVFNGGGLVQHVISRARESGLPVMVDPKGLDWSRYEGATCVTPNLRELKEVAKAEGLYQAEIPEICEMLCRKYRFDFLLVTMGAEGMYLHHPEVKGRFAARALEVYDVSGAGDTVIATLAAFYSAGFPIQEVVEWANKAAGIVVGKVGTQPILLEELERLAENK